MVLSKKETDFEQAYYKELYQTNNIKTKGWVNILSDEFKKIIAQCIGIIYPSCSEGGGGSVITCLHGGLIPIVTYESSVDIDDFGFLLKETSISAIKNAILQLDNLSENELKEKSLKAWEYARKNHTKENFSDKYNTFVNDVLLKKSFT